MDAASKLKVARAGKLLGEFTPWEANQKWIAGEISMSDDFWLPGMSSWGQLRDIQEVILAAKKPEAAAAMPVPMFEPSAPPLPPARSSEKDGPSALMTIGIIVFIIGALTLVGGLASDATGSAIRQAVFAQHMTNGILLMILGFLMYKK
jgi:hypothetical protein